MTLSQKEIYDPSSLRQKEPLWNQCAKKVRVCVVKTKLLNHGRRILLACKPGKGQRISKRTLSDASSTAPSCSLFGSIICSRSPILVSFACSRSHSSVARPSSSVRGSESMAIPDYLHTQLDTGLGRPAFLSQQKNQRTSCFFDHKKALRLGQLWKRSQVKRRIKPCSA
jgi:hypothetical protein